MSDTGTREPLALYFQQVCSQPVPADKADNHLSTNYTGSTSSLTEFDSNENSAVSLSKSD